MIQNGTEFAMYIVGSPGNKKVADLTSNGFTQNTNPIPITTKDSGGWEENIGGLRSFSMSGEGITDLQANVSTEQGAAEILALSMNRTAVQIVQKSNIVGDKAFTGMGIITTVDLGAPMEGAPTFTFDIQGTGALTVSTVA